MEKQDFVGQQPKLAKYLKTAIAEDKIPQAILLYGGQTCNFVEVTRFIAQTLTCKDNADLACGYCLSCQRFDLGIHPDFVEIDGNDVNIKKETIVSLRERFSMSAVENNSRRRIYAIYEAQNMTEEAANSLLKFLEEPVPGVTAILCTHAPDAVLPTIQSRCQIVQLRPVPREDIYKKLVKSGIREETAYFLTGKSGDLDRLLKLAQDEDFTQTALYAEQFVKTMTIRRSDAGELLMYIGAKLRKPKCYNYFYGDVSLFCSDALAGDGLFSTFAPHLKMMGKTSSALMAKFAVSLAEALSRQSANMNFAGTNAELAIELMKPENQASKKAGEELTE